MEERIQKVLARAGIASRRAAERLIMDGRVALNGEVVSTLGTRVDLARDRLAVDGKPLAVSSGYAYFALHKPRGYVSTARDERGRPTVLHLVPFSRRLFPVGRLDLDSEGLLLLTDDGDLALHLAHPRYGVPKEYHALVEGTPGPEALACLRKGVALAEGRTAPARVELVRVDADASWVRIELRQGWKRQVRRMLEAVGHPVRRLVRTRIGSVALADLPAGHTRPLSKREVARLRRESRLGVASGQQLVSHG
jgi:pseudouridine synthase